MASITLLFILGYSVFLGSLAVRTYHVQKVAACDTWYKGYRAGWQAGMQATKPPI